MDKQEKADPSNKDCANCGTSGAKLACAACKAAHYCSKACQKQHWKNGHKGMCVAPGKRRPQATKGSAGAAAGTTVPPKSADGDKECAICLESLTSAETVTLPCKHTFHAECVSSMRKLTQNQACPVCRADLPPGPERAFGEVTRRYFVIKRRLTRKGRVSAVLLKEERDEMDTVVALLRGAASEGHNEAQFALGVALENGQAWRRMRSRQ